MTTMLPNQANESTVMAIFKDKDEIAFFLCQRSAGGNVYVGPCLSVASKVGV